MKPFETFIVVQWAWSVQSEPALLLQFPDPPPQHIDTAPLAQFCFPSRKETPLDSKDPKDKDRDTFVFLLTAADGSRRFGFCRRQWSSQCCSCLCFLSEQAWFDFFEKGTAVVESLLKTAPSLVNNFLEQLLQVEPSSSSVSITTASGYHEFQCSIGQGYSPLAGDVPFEFLFSSLKTKNILKLLSAVACERRIVFTSSNLHRLSYSVLCLCSILYPFSWQYILIPSLPDTLVHYCCAPMPFIVGLHSSLLPALDTMPVEEFLLVDLDQDKITGSDDLFVLPNSLSSNLKTTLNAIALTSRKCGKYDSKALAAVFLKFWLSMFSGYQSYMTNPPDSAKRSFDRDSFEKSLTKEQQKFFHVFRESQLFEQFVEQAISNSPSLVSFNREIEPFLRAAPEQAIFTEGWGSLRNMFKSINKKEEKMKPVVTPSEEPEEISIRPSPVPFRRTQVSARSSMYFASMLNNSTDTVGVMSQSAMSELKLKLSQMTELKADAPSKSFFATAPSVPISSKPALIHEHRSPSPRIPPSSPTKAPQTHPQPQERQSFESATVHRSPKPVRSERHKSVQFSKSSMPLPLGPEARQISKPPASKPLPPPRRARTDEHPPRSVMRSQYNTSYVSTTSTTSQSFPTSNKFDQRDRHDYRPKSLPPIKIEELRTFFEQAALENSRPT